VNPLLREESIKISRYEYENLMRKYGLKFPETRETDSDHAWLTPVKGYSDLLAIQRLIKNQIVSANFVKTVLQIEEASPLFSRRRCDLLKRLPKQSEDNWERKFLEGLSDEVFKATSTDTELAFIKLMKLRKAVYKSEISQNPKGQILEPGFRVIFPE
jgi:hypothetical protein